MRRPNVSTYRVHMAAFESDVAVVIARMQHMNVVVEEISNQAREAASMYEASLELFTSSFDKLLGQHAKEFDRYRLDEVVVAAIAPVVCSSVVVLMPGSSLYASRSAGCWPSGNPWTIRLLSPPVFAHGVVR